MPMLFSRFFLKSSVIYLIQRIAIGVLTFFIASLFIFSILENIPGDPAQILLGLNVDEATLNTLRNEMGIYHSAFFRYLLWIKDIITGNMGISLTYWVPVSDLLAESAQVSLPLAFMTIFLTLVISIPAGSFSALYPDSFQGKFILALSYIGIAIPSFWLAFILIQIFINHPHILPLGGFPGWDSGFFNSLKFLLLPCLTLTATQASILTRITRKTVQDILKQQYIRTAYAKGLSPVNVALRHALPNAMLPLLTLLGMQCAFLISGAVIVENIFQLPGVGRLLLRSLEQRDITVLRTVCMTLVGCVIIINTLIECLYRIYDPRLAKK